MPTFEDCVRLGWLVLKGDEAAKAEFWLLPEEMRKKVHEKISKDIKDLTNNEEFRVELARAISKKMSSTV